MVLTSELPMQIRERQDFGQKVIPTSHERTPACLVVISTTNFTKHNAKHDKVRIRAKNGRCFAMTDAALRGPNLPHLGPSIAQATTNATSRIYGASATSEKEPSHTSTDTTTDKATTAFIRRVLCSQNVLLGNGERGRNTPRPIEEALPPLTSSNEVDLQLYGIIAVIIKEFVQTWYSKITPDHVFINEVIQIIAHCTRALEQRLRKVDLEALLLDELPDLLNDHLNGRRFHPLSGGCM